MPMISTADFKNGITLKIDEKLFNLVEFQHVNPGKGAAFVRTKIKNLRTGAVLERTFRAGERLERINVDTREMQLLYRDGEDFVFMDASTYDQVTVPGASVGDDGDYLVPNATIDIRFHEDDVVGVVLPASVVLTVADTEPGVQGDRVSGAVKPATLETGKVINVPLFVKEGDQLTIDTRTGEYIGRK